MKATLKITAIALALSLPTAIFAQHAIKDAKIEKKSSSNFKTQTINPSALNGTSSSQKVETASNPILMKKSKATFSGNSRAVSTVSEQPKPDNNTVPNTNTSQKPYMKTARIKNTKEAKVVASPSKK